MVHIKKKKRERERKNMGKVMLSSRLGYKKAVVSVLGVLFCMVLPFMLRGVIGHDVSSPRRSPCGKELRKASSQ